MGAGIIVHDDLGSINASKSKMLSTFQEPVVGKALVALKAVWSLVGILVGEALAALKVVEFSRDLGLHNIILEGDSTQVVNMIWDDDACWSHFGQIGANIKLVLRSFSSWEIKHVPRIQNYATHGLGKEAIKEETDRVWMEEIPPYIVDTITSEQVALFV